MGQFSTRGKKVAKFRLFVGRLLQRKGVYVNQKKAKAIRRAVRKNQEQILRGYFDIIDKLKFRQRIIVAWRILWGKA